MSAEDVAEFRKHLSDDEFLTLVEEFGGQRVHVPRKYRANSRLAVTIGPQAAQRLIDEIGGGTWRVPVARDFLIKRYRESGMKRRDIARKLGLTENGLARAMARIAASDPDFKQG